MVYPKPDFIERYISEIVASGKALYKATWCDSNYTNLTTS